MPNTIKISLNKNVFKIHINELPHLYINSIITGFQSWVDNDGLYYIEYSTKDNDFLTGYESKEDWIFILQELEKIFK